MLLYLMNIQPLQLTKVTLNMKTIIKVNSHLEL